MFFFYFCLISASGCLRPSTEHILGGVCFCSFICNTYCSRTPNEDKSPHHQTTEAAQPVMKTSHPFIRLQNPAQPIMKTTHLIVRHTESSTTHMKTTYLIVRHTESSTTHMKTTHLIVRHTESNATHNDIKLTSSSDYRPQHNQCAQSQQRIQHKP